MGAYGYYIQHKWIIIHTIKYCHIADKDREKLLGYDLLLSENFTP